MVTSRLIQCQCKTHIASYSFKCISKWHPYSSSDNHRNSTSNKAPCYILNIIYLLYITLWYNQPLLMLFVVWSRWLRVDACLIAFQVFFLENTYALNVNSSKTDWSNITLFQLPHVLWREQSLCFFDRLHKSISEFQSRNINKFDWIVNRQY